MSKERKPKLTRIERIMRLRIRVGVSNRQRYCRSTLGAFRKACIALRKQDKEKRGKPTLQPSPA